MTNQPGKSSPTFEQLSQMIQKLMLKENKSEAELEELENWLVMQLDKIRVSKLKKNPFNQSNGEAQELKQDGIWIFNSAFKIIHYAGMKNRLTQEQLQFGNTLLISDFLSDENFALFRNCFKESCEKNGSQLIRLNFKSGMGSITDCELYIDMQISNPSADRYVACIRYDDDPLIHLDNYQSIIFENMPGMDIFLFDKDYRYLFAGGGEKKRFNFSNIDFVGKTIFEVLDRKTVRSIYPFYNKVLNGEKTEGEVRFREEIYYLVGSPLKDAQNNTVAGIMIVHNVTNDKIIEERLLKSKEEAQKANKAKSIFIANMSHEMRTPLNAIVGFAEQLGKTKLSPDQQRFVELIRNASDHLMYLVSEVVFLFKIGMGKVHLEKIPFQLEDILSELDAMFSTQANDKKLDFEMNKGEGLPLVLLGDPFRLRQILINLLVNAVKYTEKGRVFFRCRVISESKRKIELLFEVEDTGVGIGSRELPKIFNVFEQGPVNNTGRQAGAGLGLGICNQLVMLLKGEITVKSELKVGSTFSVRLPFEKTDKKALNREVKEYSIADRKLAGKHILLADDDDHNLLLAEMILKNWGAKISMVKNGNDALKLLQKEEFDAILLDIHMPEKTGLELIKVLRSSMVQPNYKTATLAVTANALQSDLLRYLKAGFDDYLIKPYREADLYNKLCAVLGVETSTEQAGEVQQIVHQETGNIDFDVSELEKTANGDSDFFNLMIRNFVENAGHLVLCLETNLRERNFEEIGESAHKAIPSFKFFKSKQIAELISQIENLALRVHNFNDIPALVEETVRRVQFLIEQVTKKYLQS